MIINYAHGSNELPYTLVYDEVSVENTPDGILNVFKYHHNMKNSNIKLFACDKDVYKTISNWIDDNVWASYPTDNQFYPYIMLTCELIPEEISKRIGMQYIVDIIDSAYYSENDHRVLEYIEVNNLSRSIIKIDWENGYLFYWINKEE